MNTRYGLSEEIIDKISQVFARFSEVEEAVLYGSRAKGCCRPGSDIDITLKGEALNLRLLNKIDLELDELLLPYLFDLSVYHQIDNQDLREHIQRVGKTLYTKPD